MLYRLLATAIVTFWGAMTALLLHKEYGPRDSLLREVPLPHVLKAVFAHGQASDLLIYSEKAVVGNLRLHPQMRDEADGRKLNFAGNLQMALPLVGRQRFGWTGNLDLDRALALQRLKVGVTYRTPETHAIDLAVDFPQKLVRFENRVGGGVTRSGEYSLDEAGGRRWLRDQGIDPDLVQSLHNPRSVPVALKARQASLEVKGQSIETWQVIAQQGDLTLMEAHVSQLGQILRVRTFIGYSAAPEGLQP